MGNSIGKSNKPEGYHRKQSSLKVHATVSEGYSVADKKDSMRIPLG